MERPLNLQRERLLSEVLKERRATPRFDGSPVPEEVLQAVLTAGNQAPSGYNLQPWRFVIVRSLEQKRQLREAAMNQPKIEEAGAVIVCCGDLDAPRGKNLEAVLSEAAKQGFTEEQNHKMKETIDKVFNSPAGNMMGLTPDYAVWVNRHVMIAFTAMMLMAEALGYDTAPMEGYFEDKVKSVLHIPEHVRVVALLAIGKLTEPDKLYGGRRKLSDICFQEQWGNPLKIDGSHY